MQALEECVRALDPGSRALLDLSLRRRLPLEAMAAVLHTDPFDLARRRARAVARIAADLDLDGPGVIACVRAALARLADEAWLVPLPPKPVQAEEMATQARALMERLRARQAEERAARVAPAVLPMSAAPTSPFSAGLARIAFEEEDEGPVVVDVVTPPPPLGEALRRAAEAERAVRRCRQWPTSSKAVPRRSSSWPWRPSRRPHRLSSRPPISSSFTGRAPGTSRAAG